MRRDCRIEDFLLTFIVFDFSKVPVVLSYQQWTICLSKDLLSVWFWEAA